MKKIPTAAPAVDPTLHLDGTHAEPFLKRKVGDKVSFNGEGVVSSISQHEGEGEDGPTHHVSVKVKSMKHSKKREAGHVEDKASDGAKAAMDEALTAEANQANQATAESGS